MPKTIVQKVIFKNTTPAVLYNMYMSAKEHSDATGAVAKIQDKEGTSYSAYNGYMTGKNLQLIKGKLIVQSWRSEDWNEEDIDSTFIIHLNPKGKNVELQAIHANVPDREFESLKQGWIDYYWDPWKKYLASKK